MGDSRDGEMVGAVETERWVGAVETEMSSSGGFAPHRLEDLDHTIFSISLPLYSSFSLPLSPSSLPPLSPSSLSLLELSPEQVLAHVPCSIPHREPKSIHIKRRR